MSESFWVQLFLLVPVVLLALSVHEASHAAAAVALGDPTPKLEGRLTLNPLRHLDPIGFILVLFARVGWAKPVPVNPYNFRHPSRDLALTALAGPLSNVALAVLSGLLYRLAPPMPYLHTLLYLSVFINLALALFNLIPLPPLDGFSVLAHFFPSLRFSPLARWGPYILIGLIVLGFFLPVDPLGLCLWPLVRLGTLLLIGG